MLLQCKYMGVLLQSLAIVFNLGPGDETRSLITKLQYPQC